MFMKETWYNGSPKCPSNENLNIQNPQKRRNPGVQVLITPKIKPQTKDIDHVLYMRWASMCLPRVCVPHFAKYIFPNLLKDAPGPALAVRWSHQIISITQNRKRFSYTVMEIPHIYNTEVLCKYPAFTVIHYPTQFWISPAVYMQSPFHNKTPMHTPTPPYSIIDVG